MPIDTDYLKFYDDERYLIDDVGKRFRETGILDPADFYMLLIWKANRAKNRHRDRLKKKAGSFQKAVSQIAASVHSSPEQRERLRILMEEWEFALPTATAVLTILYPKEFTVYDVRVCKELGEKYHPERPFSDSLWTGYEKFREKVRNETPVGLSLRDKDRFLMGRSMRKDIKRDCSA